MGAPATPPSRTPGESVVLVHGLWMSGLELGYLGRHLKESGFTPYRFRYHSVRNAVAQNAGRLARYVAELPEPRVHFVGHSLGGLVIMRLFADHPEQRPGRIVTIGSPFQGSQAARGLARHRFGQHLLGHSVEEGLLGQAQAVAPRDRDVGVIAGTLGVGVGRVLSPDLASPSDGTVALAETRLEGVYEHLELPLTHTTLLFSRRTAQAVCAFLRSGSFASITL